MEIDPEEEVEAATSMETDSTAVPSYVLFGIPLGTSSSAEPLLLTPMGEACFRMDLTAIHEILQKTGYKDDWIANEFSFQRWTNQMQETLNSRKQGDAAFRAMNFAAAIDGYTLLVSLTVYGRRCLAYLMSEMTQEALEDAVQAQVVSPEWATSFYLQAAAFFSLGRDDDAQKALKEATRLESKK